MVARSPTHVTTLTTPTCTMHFGNAGSAIYLVGSLQNTGAVNYHADAYQIQIDYHMAIVKEKTKKRDTAEQAYPNSSSRPDTKKKGIDKSR